MTTVNLKGFWVETNYRGRPAKTLLVCGVEVGAVYKLREDDELYTAIAWPRYGGASLDQPRTFGAATTEAAAMEWVKETVESAPPPAAYKKLVAA